MSYTTGAMSPPKQILPYEREAYRAFYADEFSADFQHGDFADGVTDTQTAKQIVEKLNGFKAAKNIFFNLSMLRGEQLTGGACTVVSFRVAQLAQKLLARTDLTAHTLQIILLKRISELVHRMNKEVSEKKREVRTEQQAFNTITVDRDMKTEDVCQDKMKAMASLYDLTVSFSTKAVEVKGNKDLGSQFQEEFEPLQPGVYCLRIIDYTYNHKLEVHGHTATYIKTAGMQLYFDPALGLFNVFNESTKTNLILHALYSANLRFNVSLFKFHKLESTHSFASLQEAPPLTAEAILEMPLTEKLIPVAFGLAMEAEYQGEKSVADQIRKKAMGFITSAPADKPGYQFLTPELTGSYSVGVRRFYVEDASRNEQQLGHGVDRTRRLEIEVHYPAKSSPLQQYKVLSRVEKNRLEDTQCLTRSQPGLEPETGRFPLLIFSHGLGDSLEDYQQHVEELSSHGFCVVTVNHPHASRFTRFLGNSQCKLARLQEEQIIQEAAVMAQDLAFLVEQIASKEIQEFEELFGDSIDKDKIALVGHSLGGTAAMHACRTLPLVKAVIDIDGRILEDLCAITQPCLLIIAGKEKQQREKFEEAVQKCAAQNPQLEKISIDAKHGDFSLAAYHQAKGKKSAELFEINKSGTLQMLAFLKRSLHA